MFNHRNPLNNINDYNYYVRCVKRFKKLLQKQEYKLFITTFPNRNNIYDYETIKNNIIFNNVIFTIYI